MKKALSARFFASVVQEQLETSDQWRPTASLATLQRRALLLRTVRQFFDDRGFLEVETPVISADTVVDRHIEPFSTGVPAEVGKPPRRMWLQTSPEFAMKRLLAAGAEAIYQIGRVFRLGERGPRHNPEFTMVEWYRRGDGYAQGMALLAELAECVFGCDAIERITYAEAFSRHLGLDPHRAEIAELREAARRRGIAWPESMEESGDRDDWLDLLLTECVQPHLGVGRPAIVYDYPASQCALARVRADDPPVAERFELFAEGIELANGYHELCDPNELRRRNEQINRRRRADGKDALPERSRLLRAMEAGLPECTGAALGFDRLLMILCRASAIDEVIAFPFERA